MNRNHPYFKKTISTIQTPMPTPKASASIPVYPEYVPIKACVSRPMWMNKDYEIENLNAMSIVNEYTPNIGYQIDGKGYIWNPHVEAEANGGFIAAHAFDLSENGSVRWAPVTIINTEDAGLRYARYEKDGFTQDIGPVESACIVGNHDRPEGLYVPMCNTKAMADGIEMLREMINIATKDDRDLLPFELGEEIPANHTIMPVPKGKLCTIDFGPNGVNIPEEVEMTLIEAQKTGEHPAKHNCTCGSNFKCKKDKKK